MATKKGKRRFGYIRKLPSRRLQASYIDPAGARRTAPSTFQTKPEANDWLVIQESEMVRGAWVDPNLVEEPFSPYAVKWIAERPNLRPQTAHLYGWLYTRHLEDRFGMVDLADISPAMVRRWRHDLLNASHDRDCPPRCRERRHKAVSPTMVAKAYRLLRAILMTAVDDELIKRNPCRISGAGTERAAERPVLDIDQVYALADLMPKRLRMLVIVATFASLRYGEAIALHGAYGARQHQRHDHLPARHATAQADRAIADALDAKVRGRASGRPERSHDDPEDGAAGVLVPAS
jgi:hypothetical protein